MPDFSKDPTSQLQTNPGTSHSWESMHQKKSPAASTASLQKLVPATFLHIDSAREEYVPDTIHPRHDCSGAISRAVANRLERSWFDNFDYNAARTFWNIEVKLDSHP